MSQTQQQQRFIITKVATDWHELMIRTQRTMRASKTTKHHRLTSLDAAGCSKTCYDLYHVGPLYQYRLIQSTVLQHMHLFRRI